MTGRWIAGSSSPRVCSTAVVGMSEHARIAELEAAVARLEALRAEQIAARDARWTLLTWLSASTERITFVPTVANLPLRSPRQGCRFAR